MRKKLLFLGLFLVSNSILANTDINITSNDKENLYHLSAKSIPELLSQIDTKFVSSKYKIKIKKVNGLYKISSIKISDKNKIKNLQLEIEKLEKKKNDLNSELNILSSELNKIQDNNLQLNSEIVDLTHKKEDLNASISDLKLQQDDLINTNNLLLSKNEKSDLELKAKIKELKLLEAKFQKLDKLNEKLTLDINKKNGIIESLNKEISNKKKIVEVIHAVNKPIIKEKIVIKDKPIKVIKKVPSKPTASIIKETTINNKVKNVVIEIKNIDFNDELLIYLNEEGIQLK